jgi:hypothetical protein
MDTRQIVDFADEDKAKEMRDAFYSALQDKVMAHIEAKKMEVAQNMFNPQPDPMATAVDEPVSDTTQ